MVVAEAAWGDTTAMDCDLDTLSTSLTWVNDLRMKYRLGKYCDSRLELVDAYDPELLDRVVDFLSVRRPSSSLDVRASEHSVRSLALTLLSMRA